MAQGRVREGHGDLRAEHICLVGKIEIFDSARRKRSPLIFEKISAPPGHSS